jgi:hypothetical protein
MTAGAAGAATTAAAAAITTFNVYGALTTLGASPITGPADYNTKMNQIGGSYTGSGWKVGFTRNDGTLTQVANTSPTFGTAVGASTYNAAGVYDFESQRVSGLYTIGSVDVTYGAGTAKVKGAITGGTVATLMDYKETQIGAIYNLSKRSRLYAYNGKWTNNSVTTTNGNYKGTQTIVGLTHSF